MVGRRSWELFLQPVHRNAGGREAITIGGLHADRHERLHDGDGHGRGDGEQGDADYQLGAGADHRALAWHAYLWDPWFLLWGLLVTAALLRGRRPHGAFPAADAAGR